MRIGFALYLVFTGLVLLVNHQWDRMNRKYDSDEEKEMKPKKKNRSA